MGRIRAALRRGRQPRVAIIGAGFGGLAAAVALRRIGDDIFIVERGDGVGGTWRQNTYPGAACAAPAGIRRSSSGTSTSNPSPAEADSACRRTW
jgi:cation diffusion facilitator CzcD-associated flavoprotein CzcO